MVVPVIGSVALCVPVTEPEQLSVAVGAVNDFTDHCAVTYTNVLTLHAGLAISSITMSWVCVEVLPLPSS